ncbi:hypothetical protein [Paracoccus benzoatiresistens]|uniref:DUF2946 domain-containing protein n=1 Tax=Paracoccus benzoatiresistens TaxID=2997341 RepID=A0ABT4J7S8_9RHOB|nr:hypothetical protein [Paracoccus sp. EF6]MCZ0963184.1 hypothetical protein [Paracoccus sp. EF6]
MRRLAISTDAATLWQKLARALAVLAVVMLAAHGVAARAAVPHGHDHHASPAMAAPADGYAPARAAPGHEHSPVVAHSHRASAEGMPLCCGDACLLGLVPVADHSLPEPWGMPLKSLTGDPSRTGQDPEEPQRPPPAGGFPIILPSGPAA